MNNRKVWEAQLNLICFCQEKQPHTDAIFGILKPFYGYNKFED